MRFARKYWAGPLSLAGLIGAIGCGSTSNTTTVGPTPVRCAVSIALQPSTFAASGGSGTLSVSAARECSWSAVSQAPWISLPAPSEGQGNGSVQYTVAANPVASERRGALAVGSESATVTQEAAPCRFDLDRTSFELAAGQASGTVEVRAPAGCAWTAQSLAPWIDIAEGAEGSGTGRVRFSVSSNPTVATRNGSLEVAGLRVEIRQRGVPCRYQIDPSSAESGPEEHEGRIAVRTQTGCSWSAASDQPWLTVVAGTAGDGTGDVHYRAELNAGPSARTAQILINGLIFTLRQAPCLYTVSPLAAAFGALGGAGQVDVQTLAPCPWTAEAGAPWIHITSGGAGVGKGRVLYTVPLNARGARTATIVVAGQTVSVSQDGLTSLAGQVRSVEGRCPNKRFVIRGRRIRTTRNTVYEGGTCGGIRNGVIVRVKGIVGTDGVLTAHEVDF